MDLHLLSTFLGEGFSDAVAKANPVVTLWQLRSASEGEEVRRPLNRRVELVLVDEPGRLWKLPSSPRLLPIAVIAEKIRQGRHGCQGRATCSRSVSRSRPVGAASIAGWRGRWDGRGSARRRT